MDQPLHANGFSATQLLLPGLIELGNNFLRFLLVTWDQVRVWTFSSFSNFSSLIISPSSSFLPWVSRWPPHWPGWRYDHGGWWWTQRDWTGPRARGRDSFLSWRWSLWRDHPFDWQPGDYSQSSCNRTGLPEREALRGREQGRKEGKDRTREGRSRRRVI